LRAQGRLWNPVAHALFDRVGVREGWRVLEVGPGQGSLHLELRRRVGGPIDAVEPSPAFVRRLKAICRRDGFGAGTIHAAPLAEAVLPDGHYDLIFARWVFLFLPDAAGHMRRLARALKPGGVMAIQDYYRETFGMVPRPPGWDRFLAADRLFFTDTGGDASIGSRLPELFEQAGLEVVEVTPTIMSGAPGSDVWRWLTSYSFSIMDRYAAIRPFTPAQARRLASHWRDAERKKTSLLIAPAVLDVVGRKGPPPARQAFRNPAHAW